MNLQVVPNKKWPFAIQFFVIKGPWVFSVSCFCPKIAIHSFIPLTKLEYIPETCHKYTLIFIDKTKAHNIKLDSFFTISDILKYLEDFYVCQETVCGFISNQ